MIYFFYGTDEFRTEEEVSELLDKIKKSSGILEANPILRLYSDDSDTEQFFNYVNNASLFEPAKLIRITKIGSFPKSFRDRLAVFVKERKLYADKDVHVFLSHIFIGRKEKEDKDALTESFNVPGVKMKRMDALEGDEFLEWIIQRAAQAGFKISTAEAQFIADKCGNSESLVARELEKASLAAKVESTPKKLTEEIDATASAHSDAFKMTDALAEGRKGEALSILYRLYEAGEEPLKIMGALVFGFRAMLMVKDVENRPLSPKDAQKITGLQAWQISKYHRLSSRKELEDIKKIYGRLMQLDYRIKTGEGDPKTLLSKFVTKF